LVVVKSEAVFDHSDPSSYREAWAVVPHVVRAWVVVVLHLDYSLNEVVAVRADHLLVAYLAYHLAYFPCDHHPWDHPFD